MLGATEPSKSNHTNRVTPDAPLLNDAPQAQKSDGRLGKIRPSGDSSPPRQDLTAPREYQGNPYLSSEANSHNNRRRNKIQRLRTQRQITATARLTTRE